MRLIDADKIVNFEVKCSDGKNYILLQIEHLSDIPTAKAQIVVQGTWIKDVDDEYEFTYICSKCGSNCTSSVNIENNTKTMYRTKYCPNCGARMDGEKNDT